MTAELESTAPERDTAAELSSGNGKDQRLSRAMPTWVGGAVLASFIFVLVSRILIVVGRIENGGLVLIYVAIGLSVIAAVVLLVAVRRSKRRGA